MKIYGVKETLGVAGLGVGMGILGEQLGSSGLSQGGAVAVGFVPTVVTVGMGGTLIGMLKDYRKR